MDTLENRQVTTRKAHQCHGCGDEIPAGTTALLLKQVEDGEIGRTYWCAVCQEYARTFDWPEDGVFLGELRSEDPEGWAAARQRLPATTEGE